VARTQLQPLPYPCLKRPSSPRNGRFSCDTDGTTPGAQPDTGDTTPDTQPDTADTTTRYDTCTGLPGESPIICLPISNGQIGPLQRRPKTGRYSHRLSLDTADFHRLDSHPPGCAPTANRQPPASTKRHGPKSRYSHYRPFQRRPKTDPYGRLFPDTVESRPFELDFPGRDPTSNRRFSVGIKAGASLLPPLPARQVIFKDGRKRAGTAVFGVI